MYMKNKDQELLGNLIIPFKEYFLESKKSKSKKRKRKRFASIKKPTNAFIGNKVGGYWGGGWGYGLGGYGDGGGDGGGDSGGGGE